MTHTTHPVSAGPMIVALPHGGWETRDACGCSDIYRGTTRTSYSCRGHGGGLGREHTLPAPVPMPPCPCGAMHRLPDDPTPSDLAVQRAAALSHAHGHGWASRLTDADRVAIAAHRRESTPEEISLPEWDESADPRLPRTASEAELHSYLEERLGDGRGMFGLLWSPEPDGSVRHTTGTGRVQWHVRRDGRVTISVRRPSPEREDGVECLHAELSVAGDLRITVGPAHAELRHVDALGLCLGALDCGRTQFRALVWDLCPDQRALPSLTSGETAASYLARVRAERDRWIAEGSKKSTGRE